MRLLSFDVGVRHLAYAELEVGAGAGAGYRLLGWGVLDAAEGHEGAVARMGLDALTAGLLGALDAQFLRPDAPRYDVVLIENQPAHKNPLMKSVQMVLYTYFNVLRMYVGCVGAVRLVSATRKLCMRHMPPPEAAAAPGGASGAAPPEHETKAGRGGGRKGAASASAGAAYRARKLEGVRICAHYLEHVLRDAPRLEQLRASRKRDDLCDALLQALWYAESTTAAA